MVRPNLSVGLAVGLMVFAATPWVSRLSTRVLVAWDLGAAAFLVLVYWYMAQCGTVEEMERRAERLDQGRWAVLGASLAATVAALAAVAVEAALAKHHDKGLEPAWRALFSAVTVGLSWTFLHTVFAIHYAHEYYGPADDAGAAAERSKRRRAGLLFPGGDTTPDYWDFVHFAFVIAVAAQTADVQIESRAIRRVVTVHGLVAFLFNTGIVALGVNLAASLF